MSDTFSLQHLHWRAGFGLSPDEWRDRKDWRRDRAVEALFARAAETAPLAEPALPTMEKGMAAAMRVEARKQERRKVIETSHAWLCRMADPAESALVERMTLFWHGHFACEIKAGILAVRYLNTLRKHALGNFRELLLAIAQDPAMIRYLNNQQNRKRKPNENFARELMELFTIGRGNYSEQDVKEAARAFTGWSSDLRGQYVFRARQHDYEEKTFFGDRGNFDGGDIIDRLLAKPATATFLCRKIYAYFVNEQVDEAKVAVLAHDFFQSGYDIGRLMRQIFSSDWFYAPVNRGNKIKGPVELLAGMMRQLGVTEVSAVSLLGVQRALGQVLFKPPNVAGWPGGRYWIDNSTLLLRLNLPGAVLLATDLDYQLAPELEQADRRRIRRLEITAKPDPLWELVAEMPDRARTYLLATPPGKPMASAAVPPRQFVRHLMTLPEYQLC